MPAKKISTEPMKMQMFTSPIQCERDVTDIVFNGDFNLTATFPDCGDFFFFFVGGRGRGGGCNTSFIFSFWSYVFRMDKHVEGDLLVPVTVNESLTKNTEVLPGRVSKECETETKTANVSFDT